jgi:ATP-dependent DNA helicase RecG
MYEPSLATEVQFLKQIGPRWAQSLNKAGLFTVDDVLHHLPRRYEDRTDTPAIATVRGGQWVTIRGRVHRLETKTLRRGMVILRALVKDASGGIFLTWFNQPWIKGQLEKGGGELIAYGQAKEGQTRSLEISAPEWESIGEDSDPQDFGRIVPVYPLVDGLNQKTVRRAVRSALADYLRLVKDPLPEAFREKHGLPGLGWALRQIHFPENEEFRVAARRRLVFEEFLYTQLGMAMKRAQIHAEMGIAFPVKDLQKGRPTVVEAEAVGLFDTEERSKRDFEPLMDQIHRIFPFDLTAAQKRVLNEIWSDMASPHPMNRLVQGDVGSGKTAVACCAMLTAIRSGYQSAIMAPTEILAEQHYANIEQVLQPLGIRVGLLLGKQNARDRKAALKAVASGESHVVIGTHALIQESVEFRRLGLVVIDEQHRFGVLERMALREKGAGNPDVLVMTATPIPRTLTMAIYGDLDVSVIDELPPGRRPVKTHWKRSGEREEVYAAVRTLLKEGRQGYFVCPMVSESEKMMAQAAEDLYERLEAGALSGLRLGLLHGQLKSIEKESVMERFRLHELDALVSTTVIEVGVDVPNACVMVIEDANRFGLSQLHQLRGRVGRGGHQSFCVLIADAKSEDARERMEILVGTNDGFKIAEADLRLRGPGMLAGTQQSGATDFKIADIVQDARLLEEARQAAIEVIAGDPALSAPAWSAARERVKDKRSDLALVTVS